MSRGVFITGTDTGVGKTLVGAALAAALRARGLRVGVMKPVETGCLSDNGELVAQDARFLIAAAGCSAPYAQINPYAFEPPVAPALAAEMAGMTVDLEHLHACYLQLATEHDIVLVEGAGGLLVPLTATQSMHDLAVLLDLPVLVVARNILGVINHTALTVQVAHQRSRVVGVVLNNAQPDAAMPSNADSLRRWVNAPLLGEVPYMAAHNQQTLRMVGDTLAERVIASG